MKDVKFTQCACISEKSAGAFQNAINAVLQQTPEPEIVIDKTQPFTAYIFYKVHKNAPETVLELLEMLDTSGGNAHCTDCPAYEPPTDKRRSWGRCRQKDAPTKGRGPACEIYYLGRRRDGVDLYKEYKQIPFVIE